MAIVKTNHLLDDFLKPRSPLFRLKIYTPYYLFYAVFAEYARRPYECRKEIRFIIKFFRMEKYVRYGVLSMIDNDLDLRKIFKLK